LLGGGTGESVIKLKKGKKTLKRLQAGRTIKTRKSITERAKRNVGRNVARTKKKRQRKRGQV